MKEDIYFDPFRLAHVTLLNTINKEFMGTKDKIAMCKFGDRTQHIFVNSKYYMTINWGLV